MKITVISQDKEAPHIDELIKAAKHQKVELNVVNFKNFTDLEKGANSLGDVIYWRASGLDIKTERAAAWAILQKKLVINEAVFKTPYVTHKFYQQKMVAAAGVERIIPTWRFRTADELLAAITKGVLKYPFIAKPDLGARGFGVALVKSSGDIASLVGIKDYVFQNYIKNNGDWRVIVLGGRVLGVMKRIARKGSILNNVSQGGRTIKETDPAILQEVMRLATDATAVLKLAFCGVDIIRDETAGQFYFLEVNTAPEWLGGFQPTLGIDVADEFVRFCKQMSARGQNSVPKLVEDYYRPALNLSVDDQFHFTSRLYLWSRDPKYLKKLHQLKPYYLGHSSSEIKTRLQSYLDNEETRITQITARAQYYAEYRKLISYNQILFKLLFAESIYGLDIRPIVRELNIDKDIVKLSKQLAKDTEAIKVLSTHAVNFFFLARNYFNGQVNLLDKQLFQPDFYLGLATELEDPKSIDLSVHYNHKLRTYLLTHAIIGESLFYQHKIPKSGYLAMVIYLERLIMQTYFDTSLDTKLEFLVCAQLCNYKTHLEALILSEATNSLSPIGNFLVDELNNSGRRRPLKNRLKQSEHRSVLYLMAASAYKGPDSTKEYRRVKAKDRLIPSVSVSTKPITIGRQVIVDFPELQLYRVPAKVDTGAYRGALHCTDIKVMNREGKSLLSFVPLDDRHPDFDHSRVTAEHFSITTVKHADGARQSRYVIRTRIVILERSHKIELTLTDRKDMKMPVLLGRKFLRGKFMVDVGHQVS